MKIAVVSDEHFPHTGADTEVIVNTAAALGVAGADVTLVVPWLWRRGRGDEIRAFYGVPESFRIEEIFGWPLPARAMRVEKVFHGLLTGGSAAVRAADVVHTRDILPLLVAGLRDLPWSFETYRRHAEEKPWLPGLLRHVGLGRGIGAVAHSNVCREDLIELGFSNHAVVTARPGFALERFTQVESRTDARRRIGIPEHGSILAYVGNIHASKGMDQVLELARRLVETSFLVVGGTPAEVERLTAEKNRRGLDNVVLVGHRRPSEIASYLFAADVLFSPYLRWNLRTGWLAERLGGNVLPGTPLKLYGYLASERPIVAADQATNRELLRHDENALLFPEGRLDIAADAVNRLLSDAALAGRLARRGREFVLNSTWEARAKVMLSFFERRLATRRNE